jgi:rhamnose transport system permease protein
MQNQISVRPSLLWTLIRFREAGISIFILLLVFVVTLRAPSFLTADNFNDILLNISILAIVALAQTMVIITHGIDLSVSSIIGLVAMMVAFFVKQNPETPVIISVLLGMALGSVLGSFNGLIISRGNVPPIIATLGTLSIYRGLVFFYSQGTWINSFELPVSFKMLSKGTPLGLPNMVLIAIFVALAVYYFLNHTRAGRDIYAVGTNPDAAQFAGNSKERVIFTVYLLSGLLAGLAAVLWASRFESAQTNTASGFELQTVAASVVGGVSISGGVGTVPGVLLGALLLGIIPKLTDPDSDFTFLATGGTGLADFDCRDFRQMDSKPRGEDQEMSAHPLAESKLINENAPRRSFLSIFQRWEWMLVGLIAIDVFINMRLTPYFLDARNLSRTSSDFMEIGLMMLPMVFIIITGNIDLSVASNMGMSASFMGLLHNMGANIWVAGDALLLGTLGGMLNGYLVSKVKLPHWW